MHKLNIQQVAQLAQAVSLDQREPLMIWGQPGVGKSEAIAQLTEQNNAMLVDVRLSQYDSVDLRGIPVPIEAEHLTIWHAPATLPFMGNPAFPDDRLIVLFLDEINSASPSVAAVAYQLINDRRVGEHMLKDNVRVIAAGNRESDRGVTNRMPTPLANRFTHVEVEVDVEAWVDWAQGAGLHPIGTAFMLFRRELLSTFDLGKADKAFATPRTWVKALRYYAAAMPEKIKNAAICGAVGEGPGTEFLGFTRIWQDMPDLKKIVKDPKGHALPEGVGMSYAVTVGLSGMMSLDNVDAIHTFLERLAPEYVVCAWSLAVKRDRTLITSKTFTDRYAPNYVELFRP